MLFSGKDWPSDFTLQWLIDERVKVGNADGLPTSAQIQARLQDKEDARTDESDVEDEDEDEEGEGPSKDGGDEAESDESDES
jgi:hypothetical protein